MVPISRQEGRRAGGIRIRITSAYRHLLLPFPPPLTLHTVSNRGLQERSSGLFKMTYRPYLVLSIPPPLFFGKGDIYFSSIIIIYYLSIIYCPVASSQCDKNNIETRIPGCRGSISPHLLAVRLYAACLVRCPRVPVSCPVTGRPGARKGGGGDSNDGRTS